MSISCSECGNKLTEETKKCAECGSTKRKMIVVIEDTISFSESLGMKKKLEKRIQEENRSMKVNEKLEALNKKVRINKTKKKIK